MTAFLVANNVCKSYGDVTALHGAEVELNQGEIVALLGPNGAGKTTLIKVLATLLTKDRGKVEIMGYDLDDDAEAIRHQIGYVGQDTERSAYARLSVVENLHFFGRLRGLSTTQIDRRIEKLATNFDFHTNLDKLFVTLSGGQKQTVVIMRALLHDPPLVYLDEPTKGLDPIVAKRIRRYLRRLAVEEGKALLLTTHVLSEVDELADRVALIHAGAISVTGTPRELKNGIGAAEFVEVEGGALPAATHRRLLELDVVEFHLDRHDGWIAYAVRDPMQGAEEIIRILRLDGVDVAFRRHTATLEDAFIHHVGELSEAFER